MTKLTVLTAVVLVALSAACGDDDSTTETTPAQSPSTTASATPRTPTARALPGNSWSDCPQSDPGLPRKIPPMTVESDPFCIVWSPALLAPGGFRVILAYPESGEGFVYDVPPSATALRVPIEDAPPTENCGGQRHVFTVELRSLPDLGPLDATSVTYDCP